MGAEGSSVVALSVQAWGPELGNPQTHRKSIRHGGTYL